MQSPPPAPVVVRPPCEAWSAHAAMLAEPVAAALETWEDSPSTAALVAEGLLVRLLPGVLVPPDLLGGAVPRALALGCAVGSALRAHHVIAGSSAAWVLLGGRPPLTPEFFSSSHRGALPGARTRTGVMHPAQVETLGGAPVTVPARTVVDLVRFEDDPVRHDLAARLLLEGHARPADAERVLAGMSHHPGARRAGEVLEHVRPRPRIIAVATPVRRR